MLKKAILLFLILCMLIIMVSCGGNPIIPPVDEEGNIQITDMFWDSNTKIIEITLDPFPSTWGNWTMYIDGEKLPMEGGPGNPVIRPNASLDELPTGLLVGTLPWVSPLTDVDFPCCGTLQFNIPGEGFTNEYEFNLINFGCETASEKECTQTPIPSPEPEADELDYDEVDRFDSITDSDGLSTFNVEEDVKINVKVEDEKTGMPLSDINVDIFLYEGKIAYLIVDPSGDYVPKIIAEEQSYKNYSSQSKIPIISTIVKLIKRTEWALEGYTSGGAQFSDQIDNKFLKYLFDYIFQYGGKTTLGDIKYSMEDAIIAGADVVLSVGITAVFTLSGPIGWALIALDVFDMGDTFVVAQWAKKYESLGYSDSDYFEIYYWIPAPYISSIKIPFYPFIVPIGEPEESSVEPVNGDITNISPLSDSFILDTWYTTYVYVKNTGTVAHTFTVRGVESIGSFALRFKEEGKPISLEAGESDYLSFEYICYGDSTEDRTLIFRLYENADDEPLHYIDQMTKVIKCNNPKGDIYNISSPGDFELAYYYAAKVYVKNTGNVAHTFTIKGVESPEPNGLYFEDEEGKPIFLEAGESDYLSFEYICYGDSTEDRTLIFRLYENADDDLSDYIDQMTKTIYFEGNHSPEISDLSADPSSVNINQTTTITCIASDQDNDPLTYYWTKNVGSFEGDTSGSSITWRAPSTEGNYTVECEVSDGEGGEDSESINIVVTESEEDDSNDEVIFDINYNPIELWSCLYVSCNPIGATGDNLTWTWEIPYQWSKPYTTNEVDFILWTVPSYACTFTIYCTINDGINEYSGSLEVEVVNTHEDDTEEIISLIQEFELAMNNLNWEKAKSCCVYESSLYNYVLSWEHYLYPELNYTPDYDVDAINIGNMWLIQYEPMFFYDDGLIAWVIFTVDGTYDGEDVEDIIAAYDAKKINNTWKIDVWGGQG